MAPPLERPVIDALGVGDAVGDEFLREPDDERGVVGAVRRG
jgi:hypothetical protein